MYLKGLYVGNTPSALTTAEQALGGPVDMIALHTGRANWSDWIGSIKWMVGNMASVTADHAARWSIPLFANGGTLADAAAHKYDDHYVQGAQALVAAYGTQNTIVVRTGEEFNGNWMPWAAGGKEADFAAAYRNFVDAFRSVSGNFKFEWNVNVGQTNAKVEAAYPGNAYVDYVGMDFYWDSKQSWSSQDPVGTFNYYKTTTYGLKWLEDFAAAHGKQTAYSEWGVNSPNAAPYVELVKQWFDSHDPAYEIYWNSNADFKGLITDGSYGAASESFLRLFAGSTTGTTITGTDAGETIDRSMSAQSFTLQGLGGDDTIAAGSGASIISGGSGSDRITAGDGNNHIYGNAPTAPAGTVDGADTIVAGAGSNYINGNAGDDVIAVGRDGSLGANRVQGGQGNDLITVKGAGANSVNGNVGNDVIDASAATGDNVLRGGQGDDLIKGGHGHDQLNGDLGSDTLVAGTGAGHLTVMTGGAGADTFDFSRGAAGAVQIGGATYHQQVTDFTPGIDHIGLAFAVAGGGLMTATQGFNSAAAQDYARQLLSGHAAGVAALQVGSDTYLFYGASGSTAAIDSIVRLDHVSASALGPADFMRIG